MINLSQNIKYNCQKTQYSTKKKYDMTKLLNR